VPKQAWFERLSACRDCSGSVKVARLLTGIRRFAKHRSLISVFNGQTPCLARDTP